MLTDHHCHIQDPKIFSHLQKVLSNAEENDILQFICCGTYEDDWRQVSDLAQKYPQIIPAVGIHPWYVENVSSDWQARMKKILEQNSNYMVGEIGLDLHFCKETIEKQKEIFQIQMEIAKKFYRPVCIHNLKSWHILIPILKKYSDIKILLHSYSGSMKITKQLIEFPNIYFSFSGTILESSTKSAKIINLIPINRILLETDSPFLLPKYDKIINREYNEPANLIFVLEKMSEIKKIDIGILKIQITENSKGFLSC